MIREAIATLSRNSGDEPVFKCTGRLIVKNFGSCVPNIVSVQQGIFADIPRTNFNWIDSRFFGASLTTWRVSLGSLGELTDDNKGINFEHELAGAVNLAASNPEISVQNFRSKPWIVGQSGSSGKFYGTGLVERGKHIFLRPVDRLRRRIDSEFSG